MSFYIGIAKLHADIPHETLTFLEDSKNALSPRIFNIFLCFSVFTFILNSFHRNICPEAVSANHGKRAYAPGGNSMFLNSFRPAGLPFR